ncbi:MAG: hypothetical protein KAU17_16685, partial [Spirochaetales bacterium]|nr:hypothetical protein [Spirochaetales bacterium]
NDDPRSPENRYPLQGYGVQGAYGPLASDDEGKILLYLLEEPSEYRLGAGVIEGSVQILINDIPDSAFSVNYSTGEITINRIIAPEDRIDIFYRIEGGATQGGDLIGLFGGKFTFSPALTGEIGMGSRWSLNPSAYTEEFGANPGSIMFTGSLDYQKDNLSASLSAGFSLSTPDTTGILRLFGMEEDDYRVSIGDYNISPGSLSGPLPLTPADRGTLYYKDYHAYSAGGALQDIAWLLPGDQSYLYENGGRTGPYAAKASSEGFSGTVMVLDYELNGANEWVAGQIPLCDQSVPPDLSSYEEIEFSIRLLDENDPTDIDLYFEAGSLGEDLDGDGVLDAETSVYSSGFTYNPEAGLSFPLGGSPTGGGNGRIDTEDFNGNGALDKEHDGLIFSTVNFPSIIDTYIWLSNAAVKSYPVRIPLTSSMQALLKSSQALRFVIESNVASTTGKLLISSIRFHGSSFISSDPASPLSIGKETDTGDNSLLLLHPEVETTFHPGEISQDVLKVTLTGPNGTITAYTPPIPQAQYRYLTFYLKASTGSTGTANVSYTDGAKGVTGAIPLSGLTSWT